MLQTRERGPLRRVNFELGVNKFSEIDKLPETITTPEGVIWTDLPYFVSDMAAIWVNQYATIGPDRINFSRFLARLATVGMEAICGIALILFRDTFETPRPLTHSTTDAGKASPKSTAELTIADLLDSVMGWLSEAGDKIRGLSNARWQDYPKDTGLGSSHSLYQDEPTILSVYPPEHKKWRFWTRRAREIFYQAEATGDEKLTELAERIYLRMSGEEGPTSELTKALEAHQARAYNAVIRLRVGSDSTVKEDH